MTTDSMPRAESTVETVDRLWETSIVFGRADLERVVHPTPPPAPDGPARESVAMSSWVADSTQLRTTLLEAFNLAASADMEKGLRAGPVTDVEMTLEIWRPGFESPMVSSPHDYMAWLFLHGTTSKHSDSGNIAVLDPRAGSSMSAVPGLPWGRAITLQPVAGALAVVPGWMTSSVLPLEADQTSVVVIATAS